MGSSCGPRRSKTFLLGLRRLSPTDLEKLRIGSATAAASRCIVNACIKHQVPCNLENPASSIWLSPFIADLLTHHSCRPVITDFFQHGARRRKRTRFACWWLAPHNLMYHICSGRKGLCSATLKHQIVSSGSDPVSHQLRTSMAQPCPKHLCKVGV